MLSDKVSDAEKKQAVEVVKSQLRSTHSKSFNAAEQEGNLDEFIQPHLDKYLSSIISAKVSVPNSYKPFQDISDKDVQSVVDSTDDNNIDQRQLESSNVFDERLSTTTNDMRRRISMYRGSAMEVGSLVWVKVDTETDWAKATIESITILPQKAKRQGSSNSEHNDMIQTLFKLNYEDNDGNVIDNCEITTTPVDGSREEYEHVKLRNEVDDIYDEDAVDKISDLITLSYLHEPAILSILRRRFERNLIYTNTGPILIAVVSLFNYTLFLI
jgi:hypothetical protein